MLAGGSSRRLGHDKAFVEVGGMTLVERAVRTLETLGLQVYVVCGSKDQAGRIKHPWILDRTPGQGPLMGICSALRHSDQRHNCLHCCDMPLVPPALFRRLWSLKSRFDVVVPADLEGRIQPICGIYSRDCLGILEEHLGSNVLSILDVLKSPRVKVKTVPGQDLQIDSDTFLNVNDRAGLRALQEHLAAFH